MIKSITFRNKIAKEVFTANKAGLHDVTITKEGAKIIAGSLMSFIRVQKKEKKCWKCKKPLRGDNAFHSGYHRRCFKQGEI